MGGRCAKVCVCVFATEGGREDVCVVLSRTIMEVPEDNHHGGEDDKVSCGEDTCAYVCAICRSVCVRVCMMVGGICVCVVVPVGCACVSGGCVARGGGWDRLKKHGCTRAR